MIVAKRINFMQYKRLKIEFGLKNILIFLGFCLPDLYYNLVARTEAIFFKPQTVKPV